MMGDLAPALGCIGAKSDKLGAALVAGCWLESLAVLLVVKGIGSSEGSWGTRSAQSMTVVSFDAPYLPIVNTSISPAASPSRLATMVKPSRISADAVPPSGCTLSPTGVRDTLMYTSATCREASPLRSW